MQTPQAAAAPAFARSRMNAVALALAALTMAHALIAWLAVRRLRLHYAAAPPWARDPAAD